MTELADEELSGRQPVNVVKEVDQFEDYGYYIDEHGRKKFGVIPKKSVNIQFTLTKEEYDPYRIETTDPRLYLGNI